MFNMKKFLTEAKLPSTITTLQKDIRNVSRGIDDHFESIQTQVGGATYQLDLSDSVEQNIAERLVDFDDILDDIDDSVDELEILAQEIQDALTMLKRAKPLVMSVQRELEKVVDREEKERERK